jgi:hypothetical protein
MAKTAPDRANGLKIILVLVGEGDQLNKVMKMETIGALRLHLLNITLALNSI